MLRLFWLTFSCIFLNTLAYAQAKKPKRVDFACPTKLPPHVLNMNIEPTLTDCTGRNGCVDVYNCVVSRCEEGWGNRYYTSANQTKSLTPQQRIEDGCETHLASNKHQNIRHPNPIPGDWGWADDSRDPNRASQLVASGTGSATIVVPIEETLSISRDMKVSVTLQHNSNTRYSFSVDNIGNCRDPLNQNGVRDSGTIFSQNGATVMKSIDLLWNDSHRKDDGLSLVIRVAFEGGSAAQDSGEFRVFVASTEYRVGIDDFDSGDMAIPSWECEPN